MDESNEQLRFLSQTAFIEEATTPYMLSFTLWAISGTMLLFIIWACFANVKEVVKATGVVIPSGHVQIIQHLEGGVVTDIKIFEGQIVKKNQPLLTLAGEQVKSERSRLRVKQFTLKLRAERLNSITQNRKPDFSKITHQYPGLIKKQHEIVNSMNLSNLEEKSVLKNQLQQKIDGKRSLVQNKSTLLKNLKVGLETYSIERRAFESGIGSKTTYLSAKSNLIQQKGDLGRLKVEIQQSSEQIKEFESRLKSFDSSSRGKLLQELGEIDNQIAENENVLNSFDDRVDRLIVRAPVSGIVKGLEINTIGAVVSPGKAIMEIVPSDRELVAEIKIMPHDIGHVTLGDPVTVKITSYDFSRYGIIQGTLESVSPTTFVTEKGETHYKGRVRLEKGFVGGDPKKNLIMPGMEIMGDIVTGDKTVMQFLLKPIHVSLSGAFSER